MFSGSQYRLNCGTSQPLALITAASMPHRKDQVDKSVDQQWGLPFRVILQNETPLPRIGGKADFVPKLRQRYSELIQAGAALPRGADLNTREPISTIQRILVVTFAAQVR
jgi:hypothetical protein